jgi:hypothetical protein
MGGVNAASSVEGDRIGDNIDAASRPPETLDANRCAVSDTQPARRNAQASRRTKWKFRPDQIRSTKSPEPVEMLLGKMLSVEVPSMSTDSEAVTVTFPPCPAPRVEVRITPPSRIINRLAFNVTSPPLPLPSVPAAIGLWEGMEPAVRCRSASTESFALTVMFPPGPPVRNQPFSWAQPARRRDASPCFYAQGAGVNFDVSCPSRAANTVSG